MEKTFNILRRRQNAQGAFGYWAPENGEHISFNSAYVMDFLSEAKAAGFPPPAEMFATGLRSLQRMVAKQPVRPDRRAQDRLRDLCPDPRRRDHDQLHSQSPRLSGQKARGRMGKRSDRRLSRRFAKASPQRQRRRDIDRQVQDRQQNRARLRGFLSAARDASQYITVLARQFPARLKKISANQFEQILKPIGDGQFNTLSAAYAVQALKAYSHVDRTESSTTYDRRSSRRQTRSQPGERRKVAATRAVHKRCDCVAIQKRAAARRTGRVLSSR